MFDIIVRLIRNCYPSDFGPSVIKKIFVDNGFYELENVNGSPYPNYINHDKLKKVLNM
jgi:hypothetical protein